MIKWALRRWLGKFEREWNYDASYMRDMIEASPRAAWLFSRAAALANKKVGVVISPGQAPPGYFVAAIKRVLEDATCRDSVRRLQEAIRSTDGLSIAADILRRAFELEERQPGEA
jgi:hypothetical protein